MALKNKWMTDPEMDLDDGTHTRYVKNIGNGYLAGCTQIDDDSWDVELQRIGEIFHTTVANCKSLAAAKRWVTRNL